MTRQAATIPDYLMMGHIAHDVTPQGPILGGTVSYSSYTAAAFGCKVGVLTSAKPGEPLLRDLPQSAVVICKPSRHTTTFENLYEGGARTQYMYHRAETLTVEDVPLAWRQAHLVHLGPIAYETAPELIDVFPESRILVTPQGYMRRREPGGLVRLRDWPAAEKVLPRTALTVLSEEDIRHDPQLEQYFASLAPVLVVTRAENGCTVYENGRSYDVPTTPVTPVDPTGAGDIFSTTLMIAWDRTGDLMRAVRIAHEIAGLSLLRRGFAGAPTLDEIQSVFARP